MFAQILLLILGFILLIKGADLTVGGASCLAKRYHVPDLAIGLTIVAFGTSAPELVINTFASYQGLNDIVFGNVIGSNIMNLFVILGIAGLITPIRVQSTTVWKEIPFSLLSILVLMLLANVILPVQGLILSRFDGLLLLLFFSAFLFYVYKQLGKDSTLPLSEAKTYSLPKTWVYILLGLAGLTFGGRLVVDNAIKIATNLGMSEKLIGLTIVAVGTSLPELATSIVAAVKKNIDLAVGNIIGSNIFNIFLILGMSALVSPIVFDPSFNIDLVILAAGTIFLFIAMFTGMQKKLDRWEAGLLVLGYVGYLVYMVYMVGN